MQLQNMSFTEYNEKFTDYLEYIGIEQYIDVADYDVRQAAMALARQAQVGYMAGMSYRILAIMSLVSLIRMITNDNKNEKVM